MFRDIKSNLNREFTLIDHSRVTGGIRVNKGFTLIELLVVISIIALLSSVAFASLSKAKIKARDSQRLQNARQIALALEQYEATFNSYKVAGSGLNNNGTGYVAKGTGDGSGYNTSVISALKSAGLYFSLNLKDPIFGKDNYYLGICTSTKAYNIFVKLEQPQYNSATTSISASCGGDEASALGFSYIGSTVGGTTGAGSAGSGGSGFYGAMDSIVDKYGLSYGIVNAKDGRIWLDRNLGASRVATSYDDYNSYGSQFQWGRLSDGHELVNYTSATVGVPVNGDTLIESVSDVPGNNLFFKSATWAPWRNPVNPNLWQGVNGVNNPCPTGFRLPTLNEQKAMVTAENIIDGPTAFNSSLKLPMAGTRYPDSGNVVNQSGEGNYWSSDEIGQTNYHIWFNYSAIDVNDSDGTTSLGSSVRCIRN